MMIYNRKKNQERRALEQFRERAILSITSKQFYWLQQRGDRTTDDLFEDDKGLYVLMAGSVDGVMDDVKVYLPK
jgi:hypothetical protein